MHQLPQRIVAFDVETTGLHNQDRIVTIGAWRIDTAALLGGAPAVTPLHLIVSPERRCHPMAARVHGYSDRELACQPLFAEIAEAVEGFFGEADLLVAHNAQFDERFVAREFGLIGRPMPSAPIYCTMEGYRRSGRSGRASLNAVLADLGIARLGETHGALEDAWLAAAIYLWLNGVPARLVPAYAEMLEAGLCAARPTNYREAPAGAKALRSRPSIAASPAAIIAIPAS